MKRIILLLFILVPVIGMAQASNSQDTTVYINSTQDGDVSTEASNLQDTIVYVGNRKVVIKEKDGKIRVKLYEQLTDGNMVENDQIFEGVYMNGQSTEQRLFFTVPFTKKKESQSSSRHGRSHDPHIAGLYAGYSMFGDKALYSRTNEPDLVLTKSWEWGIVPFEAKFPLTRDNSLSLNSGLGIGYTSFRMDGNYAFRKINSVTAVLPPGGGASYSQSRLRYYHFRIPAVFEWQKYSNYHGPIFLSLGGEVEIRWSIKSKVKYEGNKHENTLSKDLNVNPIGINLLAQVGYGSLGFYTRYSMAQLFEKNKGPELYPFSIGMAWYW
ncbi:hypothetical protein EZS27_008844 [termite gut metagenome]|uniref:Outer membrane protein beta-barrel domain-containing protein n=1 Tax=termite gut metagenome TaxID=433724 RepID=A0A5J4SC64_9ZZZZ